MNILILSWRGINSPLAGGAEISTHEHAKGWVKAGHKVTLFTSSFSGAKTNESIDGVTIIRHGLDVFGVHILAFFWYLFGNHPKFDLVVDEFHGIPFFTPIYVRVKKLGFIHEIAQPVWALNPWPRPFNLIPAVIGRLGEPLVFKILYQNIPFMTVSNSTKEDIQKFGVKKITVIPNGVSLPKNMPKVTKEKDFTIIYLSAITRDKGIEDAIKAFGLIKREIPHIKFWVVGKGDTEYVNHLQELCPEAKFWNYVSDPQKFELLARAHVLLFPSIHEGWGLVIIEAASVGTPTVGYHVSGVKDAVIQKKTGLLAAQAYSRSLADLILLLNHNKNMYENMQKECISWSQNFKWNKSQKLSLKLIESLV